MTCAFVRMRLPAMTTPLPLMSEGDCLLHGLAGSGARRVENTLTTEFSTDFEGVTACELWEAPVASGEGDGAGETGSANEISGIARQMRKRKRMVMGWILAQSVLNSPGTNLQTGTPCFLARLGIDEMHPSIHRSITPMPRTIAIALLAIATIALAQTSDPKAVPAPDDVAAAPADAEKTASGSAW